MKGIIVLTSLILTNWCFSGADYYEDSLKSLLYSTIADTTRAKIYLELAEAIVEEEEWVRYNKKALKLANAKLHTATGKELKLYKRIKANAVGNEGYYFNDHGNRQKALECYFESLRLYDEIKDEQGKAPILGNLGVHYTDQGDYKEAMDYLQKALTIKKKYFKEDLATTYLNIGVVYDRMGKNSEEALWYYKLGLKEGRKYGHSDDISTALNNIGSWYFNKQKYRLAVPYLAEAVKESNKGGDYVGSAWTMANLASAYINLDKIDSAKFYLDQSKALATRYNYPALTQTVYEKLHDIYSREGDWEGAYDALRVAIQMKDSLDDVDTQKASIRQKLEYDHDLEKAKIEMKQKEDQKIARQRLLFILIALGITSVFSFLIYQRLRITKKQKRTIEEQKREVELQKSIVEEKNKAILDSINYARRLQSAILPDRSKLVSKFVDFSLLYLPKDIVAGDFYWMKDVEGDVYLAVGDCTGHGVPGALVSVVCANALDQSLKEGNVDTNQLLNRTNQLVTERFETDQGDVRDGMDIALIRIDKDRSTVQYSGAFNDLYVIQKGRLTVYKADRRAIGKHQIEADFGVTTFSIEEGDWIFLLSDGFVDQFGGQNEKKYRSSQLQKNLVTIDAEDGVVKAELLLQSHITWKGYLEQTDDICILGIRPS